jgi:dihydrolipoamide dehydrogenase
MNTRREAAFDLVVLGGGAGGLTVLERASAAGLRVALVERDRPGGECTYYGCVPTKTLVTTAKLLHQIRRAGDFGLMVPDVRADLKEIMAHKDHVVAAISANGSFEPWEERGVRTFRAAGRFASAHELHLCFADGRAETLRAERFVIATGSEPAVPTSPGLREAGYLTNKEMVALAELPEHLVVIGGGPEGVEFGQVFGRFGARVSILETAGHILAKEDEEVACLLQAYLEEEGIEIVCGAEVQSVSRERGKRVVHVAHEDGERREVRGDVVLVAVGRRATTAALNLAAAGVDVDEEGWVRVDDELRTSVPHIWAVGDVTGSLKLTHVAEYQARVAVDAILGTPGAPRADYRVVPWATFTDPPLGRVGMTEAEAREAGHAIAVGRMVFDESERARMMNEARGLVKIVTECDTGQILGASVLGPSGDELIHELALAMHTRTPVAEMFNTVHAYPTLSQTVRSCAEQAAGAATPSVIHRTVNVPLPSGGPPLSASRHM